MANRKTVNPVATLSSAGKVVSARTHYLASSWPWVSPEITKEVNRMWTEKIIAFHTSYVEMAFSCIELHQKLMSSATRHGAALPSTNHLAAHGHWLKWHTDLQKGMQEIWQSGWRPIDKKVRSNQKCLQV